MRELVRPAVFVPSRCISWQCPTRAVSSDLSEPATPVPELPVPDPNPTRSATPHHPATPSGADPDATGADPAATTGEASAPSSADAPPVSVGRYELGAEIARGGMGVVYRATDGVLNRPVAVKVLQDKFSSDSGTARRFADEARITAQLQHPAIPPIYDFGRPTGRSTVPGHEVDRRAHARGPVGEPD